MAHVAKYAVFVCSLLSLQLAFSTDYEEFLIFENGYEEFDYFRLSISWIPSFCSVTECKIVPISEKFNLHGLWPQNYAGTGREIFPSYCSDIPYKAITDQDLFVKMNIYWPNLKDGRRFNYIKWNYAWKKHGTCSLIWYYQNEYFTLAVLLFEKFDVLAHLLEKGIVPGNDHTYSVERIRLGIRELTAKEPDLYCHINNDGQIQLLEIRLCYSPGGDILDCEPATLAHTCSDPQLLFPARHVPPK